MSAFLKTSNWTVPAGLLACLGMLASTAAAEDMTAGSVLDKMKSGELTAYLAGITEGLAYARYVRDGNTTAGMGCVYGWFYDNPETMRDIFETFDRFPDHLPGAVMAAMIEKACP